MHRDDFQWGPVARGTYTAMLWLTLLVGWHFGQLLEYYVALLIFLGLCLKPILLATGLAESVSAALDTFHERRWRRATSKRRAQIAVKERDKQYKHRRWKDSSLPRRW